MLSRLSRPIRAVRRRIARWSAQQDRAFHDQLFGASTHDPFSKSYPGYLTIRRFADLAGDHLQGARTVLDLGCGPGEITCELARRYPGVAFTGVDHSAVAIDAAAALARRLGLPNVRFAAGDVARYAPAGRVDVVMMFDAFHHLLDPAAFVRHASAFTDRFFLIEPAGDLLGRWRRTLDFDWLPIELDKIRGRIEHALGAGPPAGRSAARPDDDPAIAGRAVENRYPLDDYARFFQGFGLVVRGTVAGLDSYPPQPAYESAWREDAMETACAMLTRVDDELQRRGHDGFAKHWAICATRGRSGITGPGLIAPVAGADHPDYVRGAFDAEYADVAIPEAVRAGTEVLVELTLRNASWREWRSEQTPHPIMVSYHWHAAGGECVVYDGLRTPLRRPLPPGDACRATVRVAAPASPGRYTLEIDLVEEHVSWFSHAGVPPHASYVRVT
ncbi:MAG TPA: class I SAM-dependent methyltransferase [Vicinamibacterales bacterium]|nr:class I SAM-dependent methyltransferase [Vicinamibacterales bacterium]